MKNLLIIFIILPWGVYCQNKTDELIIRLNNEISDSVKASIASDISWGLRDVSPDSSFFYGKMALALAQKTSQRKIEAYSLSDIGNYFKRSENYELALEYYSKSLSVRKSLESKKDLASGYNLIGLLYKQRGIYDSAKVNFNKGLKLVSAEIQPRMKLKLLDGLALTQFHNGLFNEAHLYLDSALAIAEEINDSLAMAKSFQNKGVFYQYTRNSSLSLDYNERAILIFKKLGNINGLIDCQINIASVYLIIGRYSDSEKLFSASEKLSLEYNFLDNLSTIYYNLGVLSELRKTNNPLSYYQLAYDYSIDKKKPRASLESGIKLCQFALSSGELQEAKKILLVMDSLVGVNALSNYSIEINELKAFYWREAGDNEKAFVFSQKASLLKDSLQIKLNEAKSLSSILEQTRYEKRLLAEEVKKNEAESARNESAKKLSYLIIGGLFIVASILLVLLLYVRKSHKQKLKIRQVQHEKEIQKQLNDKEIKDVLHHADLIYLEESLKIEQEVRSSIGKDLHDHLGSKLATAQILIDSIIPNSSGGIYPENTKLQSQLEKAAKMIETSCSELRTVSHNLIGEEALNNSLNKSFNAYCKMISQSGKLQIDFLSVGEVYFIPFLIKKNLTAVVYLLIDNILRHSKALKSNLQLFYHEDNLSISIDDNGVGINHDLNNTGKGVGLINAENRVHEMNGTMEISGRENKGTSILITIPIRDDISE